MKKIAVPVKMNNLIDGHFGHCEYYNIYTISDKSRIKNVNKIPSPTGCGCKSDIASYLAIEGVDTMLAGGIGSGAINVLNNQGISVIRGCSGDAEDVVKQYIKGEISDSGSSCEQHEQHHGQGHEHGQGHSHSCNH